MQHRKTSFVIALAVLSIAMFYKCSTDGTAALDPRGKEYAGTGACLSCHQNTAASYMHARHYKTSFAVNPKMPGEIISGHDKFYFQDSSYITIEKENGGFVQRYYVEGKEQLSYRYDINFGSGEKAQTFASWQGDKLVQLPLSYFSTAHAWVNSPGFPVGHARFNRVIQSRCFECHASYIAKAFVQSGALAVSEKLDKTTIVYGIDCERCHGPAAAHVAYHRDNPSVREAKFIASIKGLSRQQKLDVCGACHSGSDLTTQKPLFAFVPGDTLSKFFYPEFLATTSEPDVHGKQMQSLQASRCFQNSGMTCLTCHAAHEEKPANAATFVSKCMDCHGGSPHASAMLKRNEPSTNNPSALKENCVDCHMPLQSSKDIYFSTSTGGKTLPYFLRTHKIAVYNRQRP